MELVAGTERRGGKRGRQAMGAGRVVAGGAAAGEAAVGLRVKRARVGAVGSDAPRPEIEGEAGERAEGLAELVALRAGDAADADEAPVDECGAAKTGGLRGGAGHRDADEGEAAAHGEKTKATEHAHTVRQRPQKSN